MKKINVILLILFVFFSLCFKAFALTYGGCEYSKITRLKSFISNINLSYDYHIQNKEAYFKVTINNIVPEIYFIDSNTGKKYTYYDTIDGEITISNYKNENGAYKFYSALSDCYGIKLGNKYYNFPAYNTYYSDPLCEENRNYSLCKKWLKVTYSYSEFEKLINEYNEKLKNNIDDNNVEPIYEHTYLDAFVKFYVKNYYYILLSIIVICVIIMIISNKKNRFNL